MTLRFTDEQQAAIDLAATGESFSLVAPAGSGKSATAVGMGGVLRGKKVLYLVYNTAARKEAEEKFKKAGMTWVDVRTTSQIAWRAFTDARKFEEKYGRGRGKDIADRYAARMKPGAGHVPAREIAEVMGLGDIDFGGNLALSGYTQAVLAERAIERFCNSNRPKITYRDVDLVVVGVEQGIVDAARMHVAKLANRLWTRCIQPDARLRFTMNHAFKLVADGGVNYGYDVVLVDEAQDSNDATMRFIQNQVGAQSIMVGDPAQALYGWRGATDQILQHVGPRLHLTQSFRFGYAIAEEAMKHLVHTGTGVTIKGLSSVDDRVTEGDMLDPDVVLTRTNGGAMEWAISYLAAGRRVALVKGTQAIKELAYSAASLMKGEKPRSLELSAFKTWADLVEYTDEPGGGHLKPLVRLVQAHGVHKLIDACEKMTEYDPKYPKHDVAVTTCHSIKGLEWEKVQIGDDFFEPNPVENPDTGKTEPGPIDRHEAMIHYVAVTRAQEHLDRHGLTWIDQYEAPAVTEKVPAGRT